MEPIITVRAPAARDEIVAELRRVHEESVRYWDAFPTRPFLDRIGEAWSPAENVRHLTKAMRAVTSGLSLPRPIVRIAFGSARRPSRGYEAIREEYRAALAGGVQAGRFAPSHEPDPADPEARRREIMRHHEAAAAALRRAIGRWPDAALDRRRLPHPVLGKLTLREMLFFTLYHNVHHVHGVARRMAERDGAADAARPTADVDAGDDAGDGPGGA